MAHALILIFGDTVRAVEAFDRHVEPDVPRIALVDTFKDEAEESVRVADALGERLWGVRLDTPAERGRVTADLVKEVRSRLDQAGHEHVRIVVSGGLDTERIGYFKEAGAPVDSFAVGSAISDASPIDFTGDLKEIDGRPIAKRGRIPGRTDNPRLERIDLTQLSRRPWIATSANLPTSCSVAARSCWRSTILAPPPCSWSAAWRWSRGKASIVEALARAYFDQGAHDRAAVQFQAMVDADPLAPLSPTSAWACRTCGWATRPPDARHLRMAVFLKPDNEDYQRALRRLDAA